MPVDTGAIFCVFPRSLLEQLGVRPTRSRTFQTIEGRAIERDVGGVDIEVEGERAPAPVPVVFGEEDDAPVLGVTALESMGLAVDPASGTLVKTDLLLLRMS